MVTQAHQVRLDQRDQVDLLVILVLLVNLDLRDQLVNQDQTV